MTRRQSWPYLRTPVGIYALVMVPICGLQAFLLVTDCPNWMRVSAGVVVLFTFWGFVRGYWRRLVIEADGVRLKQLTREFFISWDQVRGMGAYIPGGGVGAAEYVYVTTRESPPRGTWDIDEQTIQIQNRPGVLEALEAARSRSTVQALPA